MHDKPRGAGSDERAETPALQDLCDQGAVLIQVLTLHPVQLRLSELVREITAGSADFGARDAVERAVRDLVSVGLLFRNDDLVLPTRAALCFDEIMTKGL